jgi:hypothetical protein
MGIAAAALLAAAAEASAQGYFGAPVIEYTLLRGRGALALGGRGGFNLTPSLLVGGGLYGTMSEVDAPVAGLSGPLDLKFESFGLDLEYAPRPSAPTHVTLAAFLGGGAARYVKDGTNEQEGETDFVLQIRPAIGVEQRITGNLHVHLSVAYRLVRGVEQQGLSEEDLRGVAVALALKLGRF